MIPTAALGCAPDHQEIADRAAGMRVETPGLFRARLRQAAEEGEIALATDIDALATFLNALVVGMAVAAQDGRISSGC